MAGKPSKASERAAAHLAQNPDVTAEFLARKFGLTESAVRKSQYWKHRPAAAGQKGKTK